MSKRETVLNPSEKSIRLTRSMSNDKVPDTVLDPPEKSTRTTRSMSKRPAVDVPTPPSSESPKRNKLTFSEALRQQEKAAWDYVSRDRRGESEQTLTVDNVYQVKDPNFNFSQEELYQFLTDIGVIWCDRPPLSPGFDIKQAQENAPDQTLRSVLEIVVDHVALPQADLITLLSVSWWLLDILESHHHRAVWRCLDLKGMSKAGDRLLEALSLQRYDNVEHINLEDAQDIEDHHLDLRKKCLDSVVSFNVNGCQKISDLGVFYIGSSCPGLKRFSICNNLRVTDNCLGPLMYDCRFLTDLNFSGCKNLTDDIFVGLGVCCSTLESLDISRCEQVTDFGPMFVAKRCKHLKHMSLYGCPLVTYKCLENLSKVYSLTLTSSDENVCTEMKEDAPGKTLSTAS